mmetsp:Transcript_25152/g.63137  ORF Transcript_25152/g.63137 Transcript_25152/m.63137 type:complete len:213 (+) Transcript_25152:1561-2199(+)
MPVRPFDITPFACSFDCAESFSMALALAIFAAASRCIFSAFALLASAAAISSFAAFTLALLSFISSAASFANFFAWASSPATFAVILWSSSVSWFAVATMLPSCGTLSARNWVRGNAFPATARTGPPPEAPSPPTLPLCAAPPAPKDPASRSANAATETRRVAQTGTRRRRSLRGDAAPRIGTCSSRAVVRSLAKPSLSCMAGKLGTDGKSR